MRFLITGGSGFIGQNLARLLVTREHTVTALVRSTSSRRELERIGVRFAPGDLLSGEGLSQAVEEVDCVLHLAGLTKARTAGEYHLANAEGTRKLVAALSREEKPPRLVYCSSLAAAGPTTAGRPKTENDSDAPISVYGRSKLAGEQMLRSYADRVPCVIVRPPIVYGPADREFLPALLPMAKLGVVLKSGFGPKHYSLIHVEDLCEALYAAAMKGNTLDASDPTRGVYYVSDDVEYTWEQVANALSEAMGRKAPRIVSVPDAVSYAAGLGSELQAKLRGSVAIMNRDKAREMRCEAWTCSPARARLEMDYVARYSLAEGMRQTVNWYRQEGLL